MGRQVSLYLFGLSCGDNFIHSLNLRFTSFLVSTVTVQQFLLDFCGYIQKLLPVRINESEVANINFKTSDNIPSTFKYILHRPQNFLSDRYFRYRQDSFSPSRRPSHRVHLHPRLRLGTRPEIHRGGLTHGARAFRDGTRTRPLHNIHGRDRFYWFIPYRIWVRWRLRGPEDYARVAESAGRVRGHQEH